MRWYVCMYVYVCVCIYILSRVWMWLYTGFGLVIEFIGLFDTQRVTTLHISLVHTHAYQCPQSRLHCRCFVVASNDRRSLPLGSRTVPGVSYQLLAATAHNSSYLTDSPTNSVNWLTHHSLPATNQSHSQSYVTTDGQSASVSWW
jgi:hypothetical protein